MIYSNLASLSHLFPCPLIQYECTHDVTLRYLVCYATVDLSDQFYNFLIFFFFGGIRYLHTPIYK